MKKQTVLSATFQCVVVRRAYIFVKKKVVKVTITSRPESSSMAFVLPCCTAVYSEINIDKSAHALLLFLILCLCNFVELYVGVNTKSVAPHA